MLKYRNLNQASAETTTVLESLLQDLNIDKEGGGAPQVEQQTEKLKEQQQQSEEHDYDIIKSQEFELENSLRKLYDDNETESVISNEIKTQFNALSEELQKRRDECIQLKTILVNKSRTIKVEQSIVITFGGHMIINVSFFYEYIFLEVRYF